MSPDTRDDELVGMTGRGLNGRRRARGILVAGFVPPVLVGFLLMSAPTTMGPQPNLLEFWPVWFGVAMNVVGLLWMIRIYRDDPEGRGSSWRFRRS